MDDSFLIAAYSVIADTLQNLGHESHPLAKVSDPEVLSIAVVAAKYFQNHQERALSVMIGLGYVPRSSGMTLAVTKFMCSALLKCWEQNSK